ncbi:MAG: glycosyltransferase [Hyphomicrobium sp.]|nr:glycosyltransferase [Hyphomicrobium sp.]MBN9276780.1 glycosyltransferase [Hyphomicrobium sp.]
MKVGYLMNTYPVVTGTFIRREIHALEAQGVEVQRYAVRRWPEALVDEQDKAEQARTRYILSGRLPGLLADFFVELATNPRGMLRATGTWFRLVRNARRSVIRHTAYLLEAASLKRQAARDSVDHLHAHFSTNATAVALLAERLGGPSFSFTAHGPDEFDNWSDNSLAEKVAGARFVVAISNFCRVQLARAAGMSAWNKLHVVRCGLELREFEASEAPFEGNSTFVCVGRLCPQKAQSLIVEATSRVVALHPQTKVVLIGDGESRSEIEAQIARLNLKEHVTLLGWRSNADVRRAVGSACALLLPSFAEGLPVAIMEAYALARPVITTFIAGIPELVDSNSGWIIPSGSVEHIANAMIAALEAPANELAEMGQEGRRRVIEAHDIDRNASMLRELFGQEVLGAEARAVATADANLRNDGLLIR